MSNSRPEPPPSPPIYISYSRRDEKLVEEFLGVAKKLAPGLRFFRDLDIRPGADWDRELRANLDAARAVVFFLSPDSLRTEYIWQTEVPLALERMQHREIVVLPFLLFDCDWESTLLARLQLLPNPLQPAGLLRNRRAVWMQLVEVLEAAFPDEPGAALVASPVVSAPAGIDRLRLALYAVLGQPADFELLERLDAASLAAQWRKLDGPGRTPQAVFADLEKRHGRVEPNPLWAAWVATVQPDKLGS